MLWGFRLFLVQQQKIKILKISTRCIPQQTSRCMAVEFVAASDHDLATAAHSQETRPKAGSLFFPQI